MTKIREYNVNPRCEMSIIKQIFIMVDVPTYNKCNTLCPHIELF